jgi:hypothetical protein
MAVYTGPVYTELSIRTFTVTELQAIVALANDSGTDTPPHFNVALATAELARRGFTGGGFPYVAPLRGTSGYSGVSGYSGISGADGASGYSGAAGTSGYSGFSGYSGV